MLSPSGNGGSAADDGNTSPQEGDGDDQMPFPGTGDKFLGGVCCGNQRPGLEDYFN